MAAQLPQAMTITPVQRALAIEALAACCAVFAADRTAMIDHTSNFCVMVRDPATRAEAQALLKMLAAMSQ